MVFSRDPLLSIGVEALVNKSKRGPNVKNRVDPTIEDTVVKLAIDQPAWGQTRVSNELRREGRERRASFNQGSTQSNGTESPRKRGLWGD